MSKRQTNDEFVQDLMTFSRRGALIQVFVIQALDTFSKLVMNDYESGALAKKMEGNPMVHYEAWADCAREILEKMKEKYGAD